MEKHILVYKSFFKRVLRLDHEVVADLKRMFVVHLEDPLNASDLAMCVLHVNLISDHLFENSHNKFSLTASLRTDVHFKSTKYLVQDTLVSLEVLCPQSVGDSIIHGFF